METKTLTRYATINGYPNKETIVFAEVDKSDKRSRMHNDGKYWFPVIIENPIIDVANYLEKYKTNNSDNGVVIPDDSDYWDMQSAKIVEGAEIISEKEFIEQERVLNEKNNQNIEDANNQKNIVAAKNAEDANLLYKKSISHGLPEEIALAIARTKYINFALE
jgi:hypothetical protein